jgi:hypothetical protein
MGGTLSNQVMPEVIYLPVHVDKGDAHQVFSIQKLPTSTANSTSHLGNMRQWVPPPYGR